MFDATILWLDALYIVKKPLTIVCIPLVDVEYRRPSTPFYDPTGLGLPLRASLNPPDLFSPKSFRLVEQLLALDLGRPERCVFMKKPGAKMRGQYWHCEYDSEYKTCLTPFSKPSEYARTPENQENLPRRGQTEGSHLVTLSIYQTRAILLMLISIQKTKNRTT